MKYKSLRTCIGVTSLKRLIKLCEKVLGTGTTSKKGFSEDEFTLVYMTCSHNYETELIYDYGKTDYIRGDLYDHMTSEVEDLKKSHECCKSLGYEADELGGLEDVAKSYFMKDSDGLSIEIIGK